jgi:hypothetical protein
VANEFESFNDGFVIDSLSRFKTFKISMKVGRSSALN